MADEKTPAPAAQPTSQTAASEKLYPGTAKPDEAKPVETATPPPGDAKAAAAPTDKPADPPPVEGKPTVPAKYELALPKESPLSQVEIEAVTSYAKEKGLTNDQAQELLNRESAAVSAHVVKQQQNYDAQMQEWTQSVKADKEIGGAHFESSVHLASQVAKKYGSPELIKALNETGLGSHPELVRLLARVGKAMDPGSLINPQSSAPQSRKSAAEMLYPTTKN